MVQLKTGEIISRKRREQGMTQSQLASHFNVSFQAVSRWENGTAHPDIEMLPALAAVLHTTVDALLGCHSVAADYDSRYNTREYYWGLAPNRICYEIMKILPPVRPYRVLDIGCGEGKDAVFLAKCGYAVTAFDLSEQGIEKAKRLAEHNKVEAAFFRADICDYRPEREYDILFSSGVFHFIPEPVREELCESLKQHTADGGINAMNVFVHKPFLAPAPTHTGRGDKRHLWRSGELFGYYHDWLFHACREEIFDCNSGGRPHKHCMDTLIAQKTMEQMSAGADGEGDGYETGL